VSGRSPGVQQYVVGGFKVEDKIDALAAFDRFPDNRLKVADSGKVTGNVIVDEAGNHNPLDYHGSFERRIENYIVGRDPIFLAKDSEIDCGRVESLPALKRIFRTNAQSMFDVISRWRRMEEGQVQELLDFLQRMKS
jgi:hypothetical protein